MCQDCVLSDKMRAKELREAFEGHQKARETLRFALDLLASKIGEWNVTDAREWLDCVEENERKELLS